MQHPAKVSMTRLREALEASWDAKTAYLGASEEGNPALGQCYPTSRIIQFYFPETEIVEGEIWTGKDTEKHFWNILKTHGEEYHIDLTWRQFPAGSSVRTFKVRDRNTLDDGEEATVRIELLHTRVKAYLAEEMV